MILSTVCIGEDWCKEYSDNINQLASEHRVYVLTDYPQYFKKCITSIYLREDFSYFEKLTSLLKICINNKQRVTHFDANKLNHESFQLLINKDNQPFKSDTIYCAEIFFNEAYPLSVAHRNPTLATLTEGIKEIGCDFDKCNYIDEKIISIPYIQETPLLCKHILSVQHLWEKLYPQGKIWHGEPHDNTGTHESNKWSKQGCGYGEGGALSVFVKKLNINKEIIRPNYKSII